MDNSTASDTGSISWLEVSVVVDGELAEAVAEVFSRFIANGVVIEQDIDYSQDGTQTVPSRQVRVYGYLFMDEQLETTRRALHEAYWHLSQIQPLPEPVFSKVEDKNWMEMFKKHYHPIMIGQKLIILPAWAENKFPERLEVRIDPSMAFGTGTHPSTQMCMEFIEEYTVPAHPVIDVGCGSGILSIAAIRMGANRVLAVDIDPISVRSTQENAALNRVHDFITARQGSLQEIKQGDFIISKAPLVVVNILAPLILSFFSAGLAELLEKQGVLLLSGILESQGKSIESAASQAGLHLSSKRQVNDWVSYAFRNEK